jgi:hypothetical protein
MKWNYRSFKCATAKAVKDKMVEMRAAGWRFQMVIKVKDGYALQVKREAQDA